MKSSDFPIRKRFDLSAVIGAGGTKSAAVDLTGSDLVAFLTPSTFTGVAITYESSVDGTNFYPVFDGAGSAVSTTVTVDDFVIAPAAVSACRWIKLVSGATEAAEREIVLVTKPTV